MQAALPDWTLKLVAACRASSQVRSIAAHGETFETLLDDALSECMGRSAAWRLGEALAIGHRGVLAARQGNIDAAVSDLEACRAALDGFERGDPAFLAGQAILFNQQAYVDFVRGRDSDALSALAQAFLIDGQLIGSGLHVMHLHQIQLLTNLMRLHFRRGRTDAGLELAPALLLGMETDETDIVTALVPQEWVGWRPLKRSWPNSLVAVMHGQVARELVVLFANDVLPGVASRWLDRLHAHLQRGPSGQSLMWCEVQARVVEGATERALATACDLLQRGPQPSAPFWLSTMVTVRSLIDQVGGQQIGLVEA